MNRDGGREAARGLLFEQFVLAILKRSPDFGSSVGSSVSVGFDYGRDVVFDMTSTRNGRSVFVDQ